MEVREGLEPSYTGFADQSITSLPPHQQTYSIYLFLLCQLLNICMLNYLKVHNKLNLTTWNQDEMLEQFVDVVTPTNVQIWSDPSGVTHWQYYPEAYISFSRNLYPRFKVQCDELMDNLRQVQNSISTDGNLMLQKFKYYTFSPNYITLVKTFSGVEVLPHCDCTRNIAVNIGLWDSHIATTYISNGNIVKEFWKQPLESFIMQENEVYLVKVKNSHAVVPNTPKNSNLARYIISYTLEAALMP